MSPRVVQFSRLPIRRNDNKSKNPAPGWSTFFFFVVVVGDLLLPFVNLMCIRVESSVCVPWRLNR